MAESIPELNYFLSYGPGSIYELPDRTVMILGPEHWPPNPSLKPIADFRLKFRLGVENLYSLHIAETPKPGQDNNLAATATAIPAAIFPDIHECTNCGFLFSYRAWSRELDGYRTRFAIAFEDARLEKKKYVIPPIFCPRCNNPRSRKFLDIRDSRDALSQYRFYPAFAFRWIKVCNKGHIENLDFGDLFVKRDNSQPPKDYSGVLSPIGNYWARFHYAAIEFQEQYIEIREVANEPDKYSLNTPRLQNLTLNMAFIRNLKTKCNGLRPWLKEAAAQACDLETKVAQKGDTMVYYTDIQTSLALPPFTEATFHSKIESLVQDEEIKKLSGKYSVASKVEDNTWSEAHKKIIMQAMERARKIQELEIEEDVLRSTLVDILAGLPPIIDEEETDGTLSPVASARELSSEYEFRLAECAVLHAGISNEQATPPFSARRITQETLGLGSLLGGVTICDDLSVTYCQTSFRRGDYDQGLSQPVARKDKVNWLPASQVRGEGIFLEMNVETLDHWYRQNQDALSRALDLTGYSAEHVPHQIVMAESPKYQAWFYLLHSFAHYLIQALSFVSGFNAASLRERIYLNELSRQMPPAVLISTAGQDSEGSLGGLAFQGHPQKLRDLILGTWRRLEVCSNDPVCSDGSLNPLTGDFRRSKDHNLAACFSCLFLPETSCELANNYLDRMMLVGNGDGKSAIQGIFPFLNLG